MSGKAILELVEENPELKVVMEQLGWKAPEAPKPPTLMDRVEQEEADCVAAVLAAIQECEKWTGRKVHSKVCNRILEAFDPEWRERALNHITSRGRGVHEQVCSPVVIALEVQEGCDCTATELSKATGNLKDLLIAVGARAATGKYTWKENFGAFMRWAQPVLQSSFDNARNANFK